MRKHPDELKLLGTGITGEATKELPLTYNIDPKAPDTLTSCLVQHRRGREYHITGGLFGDPVPLHGAFSFKQGLGLGRRRGQAQFWEASGRHTTLSSCFCQRCISQLSTGQ